jgi:hypothetical protein
MIARLTITICVNFGLWLTIRKENAMKLLVKLIYCMCFGLMSQLLAQQVIKILDADVSSSQVWCKNIGGMIILKLADGNSYDVFISPGLCKTWTREDNSISREVSIVDYLIVKNEEYFELSRISFLNSNGIKTTESSNAKMSRYDLNRIIRHPEIPLPITSEL